MLRILTPAMGLLAAAALLAGCGGSNNSGSGGSSTLSSGSRHTGDGLKMAQCMRANGVPSFPDPPSGGGPPIGISPGPNRTVKINGVNVPQSTLQAAFHKCQSELPQGPPISAAQLAKIRQGALKMAQCMRTHGVPNFPDPVVSAGPGGHGIGLRIGIAGNGSPGNTASKHAFVQSPAFRSAQKICMPLIQKAIGKAPKP
jgi:hypothetical protein